MRFRGALVLATTAALIVPAGPAAGHPERPTEFPDGTGSVPEYRATGGPRLLVCKGNQTRRRIERRLSGGLRKKNLRLFERCRSDGFRHIQAAVDAVKKRGTRILVLPGVYHEQPTAAPATGECAELAEGSIAYEDHLRCPQAQNLIAILGDGTDEDRKCDGRLCDLQIEGTGKRPRDVMIDNRFSKLNAIRADRADGVYFRNFLVQHSEFNSLYVLETDGFVVDRVVARWNDEYGILAFVTDHGLIKRCNTYGNGDSGIYPGSSADHHGERVSVEVRRCRSHHNLIGYSGTAGNSTHVHHNRFFENAAGITDDSFAGGHPGMPQDSARFENNEIFSNNRNYYDNWRDGTCDDIEEARTRYRDGVVCPTFQVPVGTGILLAGGNENRVVGNWIYDNWRNGTMLHFVPAILRGEDDPTKQYDTSHFNRYLDNLMGFSPAGQVLPNGVDFWWDEEGEGNCWEGNVAAPGREITSDPLILPACDPPWPFTPGNAVKQAMLAPCAAADPSRPDEAIGCDWFESPSQPE